MTNVLSRRSWYTWGLCVCSLLCSRVVNKNVDKQWTPDFSCKMKKRHFENSILFYYLKLHHTLLVLWNSIEVRLASNRERLLFFLFLFRISLFCWWTHINHPVWVHQLNVIFFFKVLAILKPLHLCICCSPQNIHTVYVQHCIWQIEVSILMAWYVWI